MKIALVIPQNGGELGKSFYDIGFVTRFIFSKKYFSYLLAIPTLESLTPKKHEIRIFDENIEEIDYTWGADIVGISVRTMFALRAYTISENFRKKGAKTVLGGIHPSVCPEEALKYADSVVIGEAEMVWPTLLSDAEGGTLKKRYQADTKADLSTSPQVSRGGISQQEYFADIVQTTKGCPFTCEFCSVYYFDGQTIRNKPVEKVVAEIREISEKKQGMKKSSIFFADDNIISNKKYARELFTALIPYRLNWSCQASINISKEEELLTLMKRAGCGSILIGLESVSQRNLEQMDKGINLKHDYKNAIETIQSHGMLVHASFILGNDFDGPSCFDELVAFIEGCNLLMPLINILTPFPGTKLFSRLEKEGRILHKNWDRYDAKNVVFSPAGMTADQLLAGYRKVFRAVYSFDSIYRKLTKYWEIDFWKHSNEIDPVKFRYRFLFALRLLTYLGLKNRERNRFIIKVFPKIFNPKVRLSTVLTLMSYNDFAYSV
ncbi:MAG: radical SAM protein [Nitrospinota bacterium]